MAMIKSWADVVRNKIANARFLPKIAAMRYVAGAKTVYHE
jgi:hypothetical protein